MSLGPDMEGGRTVQARPDHIRQIFVRDPDGYNIELNDADRAI
jgi:catechol 2,3-dioxygenase-like lactoylglutathione lyase family enzyme